MVGLELLPGRERRRVGDPIDEQAPEGRRHIRAVGQLKPGLAAAPATADAEGRVVELARMIGGEAMNEDSMRFARKLLQTYAKAS